MANQAHSGVKGAPWGRCQRCGTDQRLADLIRQKGLLVCVTNDCVDNLLVERRPQIIKEVLSSSTEMQPDSKLTESFIDDTLDQF